MTQNTPVMRIALGVFVFAGVGVATFFLFKPTQIDCITSISTFCSPTEVEALQEHYPNRFKLLTKNASENLDDLRTKIPELESLRGRLTWLGGSQVIITRSEILATVQIGSETHDVFSNGQEIVQSEKKSILQFKNQENWENWKGSYGSEQQYTEVLATLDNEISKTRPRITLVEVDNINRANLRLENSTRAVIHLKSAEEIHNQLRTLQAVLQSSTMETLPAEVDLRFKNVIIR